MTIQFDPNLEGLIKNLVVQGVTEEAARKAIVKYFAEHGDELIQLAREEMQKPFHWKNKLASHGYSIRQDKP